MTAEKTKDIISITLSPRDEMAKVIRLTTAAVASRIGLTIDQADDLNTALDELSRLFLAEARGAADGAEFQIRYCIYPDRLEVVTRGISRAITDDSDHVNRYASFILESVADRFAELQRQNGGLEIKIVKYLKR